jgi:hypothetical protein
MRRWITLVAAAASLVLTGCSHAPGSLPDPTTGSRAAGTDCAQVFNAVRCQTMTDYVAIELGTTREQVAGVRVIPQPTPRTVDGMTILETRSGGPPVDVDVTLRDGSVHRVTLHCGGIPGVACQDDPHLEASSLMHDGYFDVPCTGEPPAHRSGALRHFGARSPTRCRCALPVYIPVGHAGAYEVSLGEARLPNGILTAADFALVERWPTGVSILDGGVRLEIRSLDDGGTPIWNVYEHGWRPGTERVEAVLVFNVAHFESGATLGIKDVVVR